MGIDEAYKAREQAESIKRLTTLTVSLPSGPAFLTNNNLQFIFLPLIFVSVSLKCTRCSSLKANCWNCDARDFSE